MKSKEELILLNEKSHVPFPPGQEILPISLFISPETKAAPLSDIPVVKVPLAPSLHFAIVDAFIDLEAFSFLLGSFFLPLWGFAG